MSKTRKIKSVPGFAISRRRLLAMLSAYIGGYSAAKAAPITAAVRPFELHRAAKPVTGIIEEVIPAAGIPTGVAFEDSIQKLIAAGVIDPDKFRGGTNKLPAWVERLLRDPSDEPIVFNKDTAPYLVDLLWPIGLANRAAFNERSPVNTLSIPTFASTGGWTAGREPNGYVYFNKVDVVRLTDEQQRMVETVARTAYRPCCNNSTLFQDCNHGSALLGLFELAASQGATSRFLYRLGVTANSYWFPDQYVSTGLYFSHFYRRAWRDVDLKRVLSATFSSSAGWARNVDYPLRRANITLPGVSAGQQGC